MNTLITIKKPLIGSMKLSIIFIMIGLLASAHNVKAQQGLYDYNDFTPYEKSRCDLTTEAMEKIVKVMESLSPYDQMTLGLTYAKAIENSDNEYDLMLAHENFMTTLFGVSSLTEPETYYEYQVMEEFKSIAKWYFPQRAQVEKKRTSVDDAREKERNSGVETLNRNIKSAFISWAKKGEYEKREEYLSRLQSQAMEKYDSICSWHCISQFFHNFDEKGLGYDADSETYSLRVFHKINEKDDREQAPVVMTAHMPIEEAKILGNMEIGTIIPLNLYRYQGYLNTNSLLFQYRYQGRLYNYYFKGDFESNESIKVSYDDLKCDNSDLNSVMSGYVFDYNQYMTEMSLLTDSINSMESQKQKKIETIRDLCRRIKTDSKDHNPWNEFVYYVNKTYKNRDFGLSLIYDYYRNTQKNNFKEVPFLTSKTEFNSRCIAISEIMPLLEQFVSTKFVEYKCLFDSDQEFIDFFNNENGFDEEKLVEIVNTKFGDFLSKIGDAQSLKESSNTLIGKEMVNYCKLGYYYEKEYNSIEFLPSVSQAIENLLADFVSKNRPLERAKNRYNGSYRNFMLRYVYGK